MTTTSSRDPHPEWGQYLARLPQGSAVREAIRESWGRCRTAGIDPRDTPLYRVDDQELSLRLEASSDLTTAARQHLEWLSAILADTPHAVYVTDGDGIVLHATANTPELLRETGLEPGYDWSERRMGTNGAGLALVTGRAEAVIGSEHYAEAFRGCTCTAAPIRGLGGELCGAIDITTLDADRVGERLALATHAARVIERDLAAANAARHGEALKQLAVHLLTTTERPAEALAHLPRLLIDQLADWAVLYVPAPRPEFRTAVAHRDATLEPVLRALWEEAPTPADSPLHPVAEVLRTGRPALVPALSDGDRDALVAIDRRLALLRPASYLALPLRVHGHMHAVLLLASASGSHAFGGQDLALGEDIMTLAALALENAQVRTERDRVLHERQQAAERVDLQARLLDAVGQGIIATDLNGAIHSWNAAAERIYGWRAEEVLGRNILEVTPAPGLVHRAGEIMAELRAGRSWQGVFEVRRRDGSTFPAHITDSPLYDAAGTLVGIVGVSFDHSAYEQLVARERAARAEAERMAAEAAEAERTLHALLEYVPEGITIASAPDVRIEAISRHGLELAGRSSADLALPAGERLHATAWGLQHLDGTPCTDAELPLTRAVRGGEISTDEELLLTRPDGTTRTVLTNAGPIRNAAGEVIGGVAAWRDISDRKAAELAAQASEEQLRASLKAAAEAIRSRDEVLSIVSHDLRNPLNAIFMAASMLLDENLSDERRRVQKQVIRRAASQMVRLIEDLLDATRIEQHGLRIEAVSVHPRVLIEDALVQLEPVLHARGVSVEVDVAEPVPPVLADRTRIVQVIDNLVSNALRYSPAGEPIAIRVSRADGLVTFCLSDHGQGIPADAREHLFERFWQGEHGRSGVAGLGLSICKAIVDAHGGRIWLESTGSEGTTMCFTLPASP